MNKRQTISHAQKMLRKKIIRSRPRKPEDREVALQRLGIKETDKAAAPDWRKPNIAGATESALSL